MNILLVYPQYPATFWSFKHALDFVSKKALLPPLGLLTVASILPDEWEKKLVDLNVAPMNDSDLMWADMIFVSAMIIQKQSAQEIINRAKALGKTVVAGGPVFTTQHQDFTGVDHFIMNEAEVTLPLYLEDLKHGNPKQIYTSDTKPDIRRTPVPLWSLVDFRHYGAMAVQYSRGCPFDCEFCDIVIMNGRTPRTKTPEQMVAELQALYTAGWKGALFIVDDNFIGNKAEVKKFLPVLAGWQKKHGYPFIVFTEASINLADDEELMSMMSAANFYKIFIGIETPDANSLKECGKKQNAFRDIGRDIRIIQQHGMQVMGGFIIGFDSDDESIFEAQLQFIQQYGIVTAMVGLLMALPETRLWYRLKAEGRLIDEADGENTNTRINFLPKMAKDRLIEGYQKLLITLYSPEHYYGRLSSFIAHYNPTVKAKVTRADIRSLLKAIWKIGIVSRERIWFWRMVIKTLFHKTKAFPVVMEMIILRQHFWKVAGELDKQCPYTLTLGQTSPSASRLRGL